jgi:hypothetical protein
VSKPVLLFDNRLDDGTPTITAGGTAAGNILNLRDWRPSTFWKPSTIDAFVKVDVAGDGLAWEFTNSLDSWVATGATTTLNPTTVTLTSTGTNPFFTSPLLSSIKGSDYRYAMIRVKRTAGSGWDGTLFYTTPADFVAATIAEPTWDGTFKTIAIDLHDTAVAGPEWKKGVIRAIRFDLGNTASDEFEIDWICLAKNPYADYMLAWGHDMATQNIDFRVATSNDDFTTLEDLRDFSPSADSPFASFFAITGPFRYWRFVLRTGSAPTVSIVSFGSMFEMPAPLAEGFDPTKREPIGTFNRSVTGNPLGKTVLFEEWKESITFQHLDWSWIRDTWEPAWINHLRGTPFVLAWERTSHPDELHLVSADGGFTTPHRPGSLTDLSLKLVGLAG